LTNFPYRKLSQLLGFLELNTISEMEYLTTALKRSSRIFGGQVLAQALMAASKTVNDEKTPHSMHCYFLKAGNTAKDVLYTVTPMTDGRSFSARQVIATQEGRAIFSCTISYHITEPGLHHQSTMPDVAHPDTLISRAEFAQQMQDKYGQDKRSSFRMPPIEIKPLSPRDSFEPHIDNEPTGHWMRIREPLGSDKNLHLVMLTYMSDLTLLGTAFRPHSYSPESAGVQCASLDHSIWFHDAFRADEWLLFHQDSPIANGARGFNRATVYTQDGRLVASLCQENLMRVAPS
jgi:acyl-CoA thioesterase-2